MPIKGQFPAIIQLSSLNGGNGFQLDGGTTGDYSGFSVSAAGDFNNDGIQDIIIGAYGAAPGGLSQAGKSYVVFGRATWVSSTSLVSLNATNGFELDGEAAGDQSGWSVSTAGDVNNDGIQDIIIGAQGASFFAGKTYVIFGKAIWSSPILLNSLNGVNGFELASTTTNINGGYSVSTAGDVNNDGMQDIIIGAPYASPGGLSHAGKTYVVFGKSAWTSPVSLDSLNGTTGFELDGVAASDESGVSARAAGDVNNDGIQDIIIGACYASPGGITYAGQSYVIFGKASWTSPFLLSGLNGTNGFIINGEAMNDYSGISVGTAGDVNNDGTGYYYWSL